MVKPQLLPKSLAMKELPPGLVAAAENKKPADHATGRKMFDVIRSDIN